VDIQETQGQGADLDGERGVALEREELWRRVERVTQHASHVSDMFGAPEIRFRPRQGREAFGAELCDVVRRCCCGAPVATRAARPKSGHKRRESLKGARRRCHASQRVGARRARALGGARYASAHASPALALAAEIGPT
jgi:hypothetical protein